MRTLAVLALVPVLLAPAPGGAALTALHQIEAYPASEPGGVAVSPDGAHVYTADRHEIRAWSRNPVSGALTLIQFIQRLNVGHHGVVVSPDGAMVYATAAFTNLLAFSRDPLTGLLTETDREAGVGSVLAVSPDNAHVYVATRGHGPGSLIVYRVEAGGEVVPVETLVHVPGEDDGLRDPSGLTLSSDGATVYVESFDGIANFSRNAGSGALAFVALTAPSGAIAITPDDRFVLAAGRKIVSYARAPATGMLSPVTELLRPRFFPMGLRIAPDGTRAFLTSFSLNALTAFGLDAASGELTVHHALVSAQSGVSHLGGATGLAVSPDGGNVYVASSSGFSVATVRDVACDPAPRAGCATPDPRDASLSVKLGGSGTTTLTWKWQGDVPSGDLGVPVNETGYALCVYDGGGALTIETGAPGGGSCGGAACFTQSSTSVKFAARTNPPPGLKKMSLRSGSNGSLSAGGTGNTPNGPPLPLTLPATVQLQRLDDPHCWTAAFSAPTKHSPVRFLGRSD